MIAKVGVIYQDRNSRGFLLGLRDRLKCEAEFIDPPAAIGRSRRLTRRQAKLAWEYFQKRGADLIVRFTDADRHRWQEVRRNELEVFAEQARAICICGVAVDNVEDWLCLDPKHFADSPRVPAQELQNPAHRADRIKRALAHLSRAEDGLSHVTARIVRDAPRKVFRQWLENGALRMFYSDCRAAAARADCETPNELGEGE